MAWFNKEPKQERPEAQNCRLIYLSVQMWHVRMKHYFFFLLSIPLAVRDERSCGGHPVYGVPPAPLHSWTMSDEEQEDLLRFQLAAFPDKGRALKIAYRNIERETILSDQSTCAVAKR